MTHQQLRFQGSLAHHGAELAALRLLAGHRDLRLERVVTVDVVRGVGVVLLASDP